MMDYPSPEILIARGKLSTLNRRRRYLMKELQSFCTRIQTANLQILSFANESKVAEGLPKTEEISLCLTGIQNTQKSLMETLDEMAEYKPTAWGDS